MQTQTRRGFLSQAVALAGTAALGRSVQAHSAPAAKVRVGACVVGLEQGRAAEVEGIEVRVGAPADRLEIADPAFRARVKEQMRETGLVVPSLMMGLLNDCPLATDARAPAWLEQSIDGARDLGAKVILVAFFGNGDLLDRDHKLKQADVDSAVARLKAAAPRAKDAGVVLAIENYLNAEQNARILDRINHDSVKIYYDCYNTGGTMKYDVPSEIRALGGRIAQFHFKNGPDYLDDGEVRYEPIAKAIDDVGFQGWIVLETGSPSRQVVGDTRRNARYARSLFSKKG